MNVNAPLSAQRSALSTSNAYADWKAPADDGEVLLWPAGAGLLAGARRNHTLLSKSDARIQNVPLSEARTRLRQFIGHTDDAQLLFATGHQTELHHPGVWVKNALIDAAAARAGGAAYHFAVDTDEPKHLRLRWPGGGSPLTDDPTALTAAWAGLVASPTPGHLAEVSNDLRQASAAWNFQPVIPAFLDSMRKLALEAPTLPSSLTNSLHALDWSLGLRHAALLFSPLCDSEPYLAFVHHVLARAGEFAADYNASLDDYRTENKIRTAGRPMPNLKVTPDACEVPFWFDDVSRGSRTRAGVKLRDGKWLLHAPDGETFAFDVSADAWEAAGKLRLWLRKNGFRLAPRALTLTTVLRLLVADQFVHGIGGGRYDQVLDRLIQRHFGIEPPRFCVTTATLYFPHAVGRMRACEPCIRHEGHRLRHSVLGAEKMDLVGAIDAAPRGSVERSRLFFQMHDKLEAAASHPTIRAWEQKLAETERNESQERDLFDRELFYAIQPAERLSSLIEWYRNAFASVGI